MAFIRQINAVFVYFRRAEYREEFIRKHKEKYHCFTNDLTHGSLGLLIMLFGSSDEAEIVKDIGEIEAVENR